MEGLSLTMLVLVCRFVPMAFVAFWFIAGLLSLAVAAIMLEIVFKIVEIIVKKFDK
ncbi:MAG: hypothetical protein RR614_07900 [Eubacterium sp.]